LQPCFQATRGEKLTRFGRNSWANENGLTRVHSAGGDFEEFDLYDELLRHGDLTLRFYVAYFQKPPRTSPERSVAIEDARKRYTGDGFRGGSEFMIDGVVESHTAAMLQPLLDDRSFQGQPFWDPGKVQSAVANSTNAGCNLHSRDRRLRCAHRS
jgi:predicted amidohydrolase YtcJ